MLFRSYFKLLAHKDEFEVARLLSDASFRSDLQQQFEGKVQFHAHLAGGPFSRTDASGRPLKTEVGRWIWPALSLLARFKSLRGSWLDPWRNSAERQLARQCLADYEQDLDLIESLLKASANGSFKEDALAQLLKLARWPNQLRGYGHVRDRHAEKVQPMRRELREGLHEKLRDADAHDHGIGHSTVSSSAH